MGGFAHSHGGRRLWTELVDMTFSSGTAFSDAGHSVQTLLKKHIYQLACQGKSYKEVPVWEVEKLG